MEEQNGKSRKKGLIITLISFILIIVILGYLGFGYYKKQTLNIENPMVTIDVKDFGTIKVELYPEKAPETVANFVALANNGFYNGLKFHRIVKDFMIQGGDSNGDGTGSAKLGDLYGNDDDTKYCIKGEFLANGYKENDLNLTEGVIAMARADYTKYSSTLSEESYNSAGTQFFIMTSNDNTNLSGYYAGFGKVVEGMDVVKKISEVEVKSASEDESNDSKSSSEGDSEVSTPVQDVIITSVNVDTHGVDYGLPSTLEPFDYMSWLYKTYGISTQQ